ncbi:phage protein NinX family protein [Morganella morganii]
MSKYSDKSDFEINESVAYALNLDFKYYLEYERLYVNEKEFDPCNHPYDAMPIVIENRISIESRFNGHYDEWYASLQTNKILIDATGTNYYRVAMEVFLMMKDAENEKV